MARIAVQFVANSNMGAVTKDIARINAQLAALAHEMAAVGQANPAGMRSLGQTFRNEVSAIKGFEVAQMSARTVTSQLTEDINRQKIQLKDLSNVRKNVGKLAQEQLRLEDSSARIVGRTLDGRAMGDLIVPTNEYARSSRLAGREAGIMGRAIEAAGIQTLAAGKRMQWTGRQLTAGLTAPIVAVAAVSAKAAYDIDAAMVRLTKVYGDLGGSTEEELQNVREATMETARVVAESYGISGKATVELAADLAAAGYEGQRLQETTREIQRISLLGELDQQKAMDATRTIQTVFGISTMDLADKFNFLNAVENQTNTTLQDLTEVIPRTAGVIKDLGGTLEDSAVFTVAFKEAGIDAVQGANALRSSLGAIVAPSGVASKKLQALGIDMAKLVENNRPENGGSLMGLLQDLGTQMDSLGSVEKQQAMSVLFGRYQFNKMNGLLKGLAENANNAGTQVGRAFALTAASTEELADVADREIKQIQESLSGRLRRAGAQVMITFAELGRPVLAIVVGIAEAFAAVLNVINSFPGPIKAIIGLFGGILALAGPLLFFKGIFMALKGVTMGWYGAQKAARAGVGELQTAQSTFQQHANNAVIPTIVAETDAITRLGAAFRTAAQMTAAFAAEQNKSIIAPVTAGKSTKMVQTRVADGGRIAPAPNPLRPVNPMATTIGTIGAPGMVLASAQVAENTDKVEKGSARIKGQWTGIATSMLLIAPLLGGMAGATGGWLHGLTAVGLVLLTFPTLLTRIGSLMRAVAGASMFAGIAGKAGAARGSLLGFAKGANIATLASRAFSVAIKAMMGPLGLVIAAISVAMLGYRKYKKEMQEARDETHAIHTAGKSLAQFLGFEYPAAQLGATEETKKGTKTLHDQARAWAESSKEAKKYADIIKGQADIERAAALARQAGRDARAAGLDPVQAMKIAKLAMAAGGYSEVDINDALNLSDFLSQQAAIESQFEAAGEAFTNALTESFKDKARAEQSVKEFGTKIASTLNTMTKPEIFQALTELDAEITSRAGTILSDVKLDSGSLDILGDFDVDPKNLDQVLKFFKDTLPAAQASGEVTSQQAAALFVLGDAAEEAAGQEAVLVEALKEQLNWTSASYDSIDTLAEVRRKLTGINMSASAAQAAYNEAVAESTALGEKLSESDQLALKNMYERQAGLPVTTSLTDAFGVAVAGVTAELEESKYAFIDAAGSANEFVSAMKGRMGENVSEAIGMLMDQFDDQTKAYKDGVEEQNDVWMDGLENRKQAAEDEFEARQRREERAFEDQERAMDTRHDKEIADAEALKNSRVKAIEDEMDKADALDAQRKKMFDAEITRMQRLQGAANRNIDFNVALKTGNLDEAARLQSAAYTEDITNGMGDASDMLDAASEERRKQGDAKVARVTNAEDARIQRIKDAQEVEKRAFEDTKQRAKDALDDAKRASNERFETEKRNYQRTAEAAERAYDRTRAAKRKQVQESLEQTALEVPRTQEEYNKMFNGLAAQYEAQTQTSAKKTREWTDLHRGGFKKAMDDTLTEMGNSAAWGRMGKHSMDQMTQGMLGMSFDEYIRWVETGVKPAATVAGQPVAEGGNTGRYRNIPAAFNHAGGPVNGRGSGRAGRPLDAPLYPDEVPTVLQKGEYVLDRDTVKNIGVSNIQALHAAKGQTSFFHSGGMVGAVGSGILGTFRNAMEVAVQKQARRKTEELAAAGQYDSIPDALKFFAMAAKGGKYGGTDLTDEQLRNAATIIGVGRSMGASDRDVLIGIMTALQESTLRNIDYGDRDSVGLFQQRPSQGWGTIAQIMDPKYSSRKFFEKLLAIKGREQMGLSQAAQAVQRSAFPDAYAKWEDEAQAILAATMQGAAGGLGSQQYTGGGIFRSGAGTVFGDIKGLNVEFLNRLARWSAAVGEPYKVGSGYRSMEEQARLYNAYLAGVPGQAPAAPPGRSNHNYGLASDGPRWGNRNPGAFGLRYPMSYEPWHVEPIGAREMRIPQLEVGGKVRFDDTIANLHKNETVLTAPLSKQLEQGINSLDSGGTTQYNININGTGLDANAIANEVMTKIQRKEQIRGPKRVIRD